VRRALREKLTAAAPVASCTITDQSCAAATGFEPRQFRDFIFAKKIPHVRHGRRIVVRTDAWLAAIQRLEAQGEQSSDVAEPDAGDVMLSKLGRVRAIGGRR
jgi:hypothetical protein